MSVAATNPVAMGLVYMPIAKTQALPSMPIPPKAMAMVKQPLMPIAMSQSVAPPIKTLVVILS